MAEVKAANITWHEGAVKHKEHATLLKQQGATLWFTGLSGSGKSTLAYTLEHNLFQRGHLAYVLDGDNVRHGLNKNLDFSTPTARRTSAVSARSPNCSPTPAC